MIQPDRFHDVVYRYDPLERRYVFWNKVGLLTYGEHGDVEYPTRTTVIEMVLPEDRERVRRVAKASLMSKKKKGEVEYRIRWCDGSIRHMYDRWIVIRDESDRPIAIEGGVRDTTEAKKILEELHESRESYRRLVEAMKACEGGRPDDPVACIQQKELGRTRSL